MKTSLLKYLFITCFLIFKIGIATAAISVTVTGFTSGHGLTSSTVNTGTTQAAYIGFSVQNTGATAFTVSSFESLSPNFDPTVYLANVKLMRSTTSSTYSTSTGGFVSVGTVGLTTNSISLTGLSGTETIPAGATYYYFLVADDVYAPVSPNNSVQFIFPYIASFVNTPSGNGGTPNYFAAQYVFQTPAAPVLTITNLTTGVSTASGLTQGQTGLCLFGFSMKVVNSATFSQFSINSGNASLGSYLTNVKLYSNTTSTYGTGTATQVGTATISGSYVNITSLAQAFTSGQTNNYFLVADYTGSGAVPSNIQFNFTSGQSTAAFTESSPVSATYNTYTVTGNSYSFNYANVTITSQQGGTSSTTLTSSQTGVVLFGFGISSSNNITVSAFNINSNNSNTGTYFGNGKLMLSSTATYGGGTLTQIGTATFSGNYANVTLTTNQAITSTAKYYFLVADVIQGCSSGCSVAFNFTSGQSQNAVIQTTPTSSYNGFNITGNSYTLPAPTVNFAINTNGVNASTTLFSGQTGIVLYGVTFTSTGPITITSPIINFNTTNSNPLGYFPATGLQLWESTSGTFATATQVSGVTFQQSGAIQAILPSTFVFTTGVNYTFYLVGSFTGTSAPPASLPLSVNKFYSNSTVPTYTGSIATTTYSLISGTITVADNNTAAAGITPGVLTYGQTGIVLFSFSLTGQGNLTVNSINIPSNHDMSQLFNGGKLYRSTDQYFSHAVATGGTVSFNQGSPFRAYISGLTEAFTTTATTYYYFLVADFLQSLSYTNPGTVQFNFATGQSSAAVTISTGATYTANTTGGKSFTIVTAYDWCGCDPANGANQSSWTDLNNFHIQNGGSAPGSLPSAATTVYIGRTAYTTAPTIPTGTNIGALAFGSTQAAVVNLSGTLQLNNGISSVASTTVTINGGTITIPNTNAPLSAIGSSSVITFNGTTLNNAGTFSMAPTSRFTFTGTNTLANTGTFTLQSDATGSATMGDATNTTFTGSFNVQRFITGGDIKYRGYRLLSSPVTVGSGNVSLAYLNKDITTPSTIFGALTGGPGTSYTVNNAVPTLFLYDESRAYSNTATGGKNVGIYQTTPTDVSTTANGTVTNNVSVPVGNGYFLYFVGDDHSSITASTRVPENTTITATGTLNRGTINFKSWTGATTLSYANPTAGGTKGFNLVGNPYASTIDLRQLWLDNASPAYTAFYILGNINPGQTYSIYNGNGLSNSASAPRYVASGQGFFVLATATGQTLKFTETSKVTTQISNSSTPVSVMTIPTRKLVTNGIGANSLPTANTAVASLTGSAGSAVAAITGLHLMLQKDSITNAECGIYFGDKWSDNIDDDDAPVLVGYSPKVYMSSYTSDGVNTGINALGNYTNGKRIKLYVRAVGDGLYKLKMTDIENIDTTMFNVYLVDNFKKDSLDIGHYKSYSFNILNADTNSFGANRFVLSVERRTSLSPYQLISFSGKKINTGVQINWTVYNAGNYTSFLLQKLDANNKYTPLYAIQSNNRNDYNFVDQHPLTGNNTYRLAQTGLNGQITYSAPISIGYGLITGKDIISIYPNPAKDIINVSINIGSTKTATYSADIYNTSGTLIKHTDVNTNTWSENVSAYKLGIYVLQLKNNNGDLIGKSKFIKVN